MNKAAIQKFAVWARAELLAQTAQRAYQYGVTAGGFGDAGAPALNGRVLTGEEQAQRRALIARVKQKGYAQVIEEVAYTWFNRFTALRFLEVNGYLPGHIRVFSDRAGAFKPEILNDVLHLELEGLDKEKAAALLEENRTEDLYRYLLLVQCNALHKPLPGMFEPLDGYTALLLPNHILRPDSVPGRLVSDVPEEDWTDQVQIIGWLYQYYNSEVKDETFALLKRNVKVSRERIPAATQLFTPDWIVRYMVENSLGRLWLEGHPDGALQKSWRYYLPEAEQTPEVRARLEGLRRDCAALRPEDLTLIDPCMGSGHILAYAFDVLMDIYLSAGWSQRDAARSIVEHNLHGLDVDPRAAQLAYFAVMMKAVQYDRRFLTRGIQPRVYAPGPDPELEEYGSLLLVDRAEEPTEDGQLTLWDESKNYRRLLAGKYHVVVTNPPYMGGGNMNPNLAKYVKDNFPDEKNDLFACFIERGNRMIKPGGYNSMVTMQSWMFLSSFEKMREAILKSYDITSLMHMENMVMGIAFGTAVTVLRNSHTDNYKGTYNHIKLADIQNGKPKVFPVPGNRFARVSTANFSKIPGSPVAYWLTEKFIALLGQERKIGDAMESGSGLSTADNERFLRFFWEISCEKIALTKEEKKKWFFFQKGGEYRKWYGNLWYVVNWENDGAEIKYWVTHNPKDPNTTSWSRRIFNTNFYFQRGITWSVISSGDISFRATDKNAMISNAAGGIFGFFDEEQRDTFMAAINSKIWTLLFSTINPTINYSSGVIQRAPLPLLPKNDLGVRCVTLSKTDWDSYETSWDFKKHPMI